MAVLQDEPVRGENAPQNFCCPLPKVPVSKLVSAFVRAGLGVSEAVTVEESLEDYFKRVTGGEGIA